MSDALIEPHPTRRTIKLGDTYIKLSALARTVGIAPASMSRILAGKGNPIVTSLQRIGWALDMSVDELMAAIEKRQRQQAVAKAILRRGKMWPHYLFELGERYAEL